MLENLGSQTSGCCCNIAACWNYNKRAKKKKKKKKYASLTTNYGIHLWVDTKLEAFKICSLKLLKYV